MVSWRSYVAMFCFALGAGLIAEDSSSYWTDVVVAIFANALIFAAIMLVVSEAKR
jgi:hypothetical protein